MSTHASVLTAATTLVDWAHARRRRWTDEPLPKPQVREVLNVRDVLKARQVPEVSKVPTVPEVPEVSNVPWVPEVPEVPEVLWVSEEPEVLEVPPVPGVREVWEAAGVLGLSETPVPDVAPAIQNTQVLSLAADITLPRAADADVFANIDVDAAPRAKWADAVSRLKLALLSRARSTDESEETPGTLRSALLRTGRLIASGLERLRPLGEPSLRWLTRGAALVSTTAVLMLFMVHRADLFSGFDRAALVSRFEQIDLSRIDLSSHLDRVKQKVTAAANAAATRPAPPPPPPLPRGIGQLTIASSNDDPMVFVDGKARGKAPVTVLLPAGSHRVLLRSAKGSIERTIRVDSGESSAIDESIFPGWVAVSAAVDLTLRENGRTLKRDERGWAILSPGPHEIHLDNDQLGIHETRKVVVTPGDTTRLSLAPQNSTLSIATNEPAEIWIDGTSVGEAPLTDAPMTLGVHDVRIRSAAHERWLRVRVTLHPVQMNVDLTAE
jgi:hypothetical protein